METEAAKKSGSSGDHRSSQESSRWEQGNEYLSQEQLNSLPDVIDEEVTSIITIEDVMEKLLQFNAVVPSKPSPPSAVVDADVAGSSDTSPLQDYDGEGDDEYFTDARPLEPERLKALRIQWAKYYMKLKHET
ncbi:hypothetical protein JHK87_024348 [Glycine soja]|nr:hypothetical protein JHK87_024348 [Glycine soja]